MPKGSASSRYSHSLLKDSCFRVLARMRVIPAKTAPLKSIEAQASQSSCLHNLLNSLSASLAISSTSESISDSSELGPRYFTLQSLALMLFWLSPLRNGLALKVARSSELTRKPIATPFPFGQ